MQNYFHSGESMMAFIGHCELLQQGLQRQKPSLPKFGSPGVCGRDAASLIGCSLTTRISICRRNSAILNVLSIQTSGGRPRPLASLERVSEIQNCGERADGNDVDAKEEIFTGLETERISDSEEPARNFGVEETLQRFAAGSPNEKLHGGKKRDTEEPREGHSMDHGNVRDGGSAQRKVEGKFPILESKRMKRSRITNELIKRGTSPVKLLESMEKGKCTPDMFWTVVNILCVNSRVPEALLVFEWWKRQEGYLPIEQQYTSFISICGRSGLPDKAQILFDEMKRLHLRPTVATYSCLLQGFAEVGSFNRAKEILAEMREAGLNPNAITYTGLLLAYGKQGYYSEMAKIFNDMKTYQVSQPECAPTSVTYSALLQCFAKGGLFSRMEKALKEMTSKDLVPDGVAVNAMIQAYAEAGLVKEMEKSYSLVRPLKVAVRVETVRAVASAYIRKSYFYQLGTFARYLNRRRVVMGQLIENLLLLSHAANFSMRGLAEEYVRLKELGFEGDITTFNLRALAFSRMQMFWDLRVTVLEMVHQGVLPDLVTYGAVVDAYVTGKLQSNLSEALAEMPNLDRVASTQTDALVFEAFGRGDFQACCEDLILSSQDTDERFFTYANLVGYYLQRLEILSTRKVKKRSGSL